MTDILQLEPGSRVQFFPVTIPTAADGLSLPVDLNGYMIKGIIMPGAWDAAALTFQANKVPGDDGGYQNVVASNGTETSITVAASRYVTFVAAALEQMASLRYIKVRSGPSAAPVQQSAARDLIIVGAMSTR